MSLRSSCAPSRWTVSQEVSWPPRWPTEASVQSQVTVCWALKLFVIHWVSCTPVGCTTSRGSLPSTWVTLFQLSYVWKTIGDTNESGDPFSHCPVLVFCCLGGLASKIWGFRCCAAGGSKCHGPDVLVASIRSARKQCSRHSLLSGITYPACVNSCVTNIKHETLWMQ